MKKKYYLVSIVILIIGLFISACQSQSHTNLLKEPIEEQIFALGTYIELKVYDKGKTKAVDAAIELIRKYDKEISVNNKGSVFDEINENAGIKPIKVPGDIMAMLTYAKSISGDVGEFDITIGSLSSLWHIGFEDAKKPTQEEIDQALLLIDYNKMIIDLNNQTVFLSEKGMKLDAGAIAKGFITDQIVSLLKKEGVTSAIVNLGGNVFVIGNSPKENNQKQWTIGIQNPDQARNTVLGYVKGSDTSVVTSGIYERYLKVDNQVYHHILNPKTGYPFDNDLQSVTIVGKSSMKDDAYATIAYSLGLEKGLKYINEIPGYEAIFVTQFKEIYLSEALINNFEIEDNSEYTISKLKD